MKKILALMLILLVGLFAGCITDSDDDDGDKDDLGGGNGAVTGTADEYFPVAQGGIWTFDESTTYPDGSSSTVAYTLQSQGTQTVNGNTYTVLSDSEGDNLYFRTANNIVYMYDPDMDAAKASPAKAAFIAKIAAEDHPWFDFTKGAGGTWAIYDHTEQYDQYSYSWKTTGKYVGSENVTVPSGSYSNCMKFEITDIWTSTGNGETWTETYTQTFWLAKNVGPVKIVEVSADPYEVFETSITVLKSYDKDGGDDGGSGDDGGGDDGGDDDGGSGDSGTAGTHAFYPFKTGASWQYSEVTTDLQVNNTYTTTHVETILGTKLFDGKTYWEVDTDNESVKAYVRIEDGIVYVYGLGGEAAAKLPAEAPAAMKQAAAEVNPYEAETAMLKLNASVGESWDIVDYSFVEDGTTVTMTWTGTYLGTENVTVPAGSFSNCRKYQTSFTTAYTYSGIDFSSVITDTIWLASGVGMVKSSVENRENDVPTEMSEEQLTYYYIP